VSRFTIAVIGGGVWTARLAEALATELPRTEAVLRLAARRVERLRIIAGHAARRLAARAPAWSVRSCSSPEEAVDGADLVVVMIRVGGSAARAHDESFPVRYGLVGDEGIGVGGLANAWRTVSVLEAMAAMLRRRAPGVRVLNLVAPLGITTRVLLDAGVDCVGVCELPLVTREQLLGTDTDGGALAYAGLNHLGWFRATTPAGERALATGVETGRVDAEILERFGAAPLHYYYEVFDPEAGRRLGRVRRPGRAQELAALDAEILAAMTRSPGGDIPALERRATPWYDRALVPFISALAAGTPYRGFANVRNADLLSCAAEDVVVEAEAQVGCDGVRTFPSRDVPEPVARFLLAVSEAERLTYRAARERSTVDLAQALQTLPLPVRSGDVPALVREIVAQ